MNFSSNSFLLHFSFCVRRAMIDTMPLHWQLFERTIFDHEIIYIEDGELIFTIEDIDFHVKKDDLILIPPGVVHSLKTIGDKRLTQPHVHFDFQFLPDFEKVYIPFSVINKSDPDYSLIRKNYFKELNLPFIITPKSRVFAEKINDLLKQLIDYQLSTNNLSILDSKRTLIELVLLLLHHESEYDSFNTTRYESYFTIVNLLIEKQINSKLDLGIISDKIGYSKNHLSKIYKDYFGISLVQYHEKIRINKAKEYLNQPKLSISEISDTLGFSALSDFSRFFKRIVGQSPYKYRQIILNHSGD